MINMKWHKVKAGHWRSGQYIAYTLPIPDRRLDVPNWTLVYHYDFDGGAHLYTLRQAKQTALAHAQAQEDKQEQM